MVIQGYSINKDQMQELIDYYKNEGFENIVISSYSKFIPNNLIKNKNIVINDDLFKRDDKFKRRNLRAPNLNFQIETTKRGIAKCLELYPTVKHLIKVRADHRLDNLGKFINAWKKLIIKQRDDIFDGKIMTQNYCKSIKTGIWRLWFIRDWWSFGCTEDMQKYHNIPYCYEKGTKHPYAEWHISSSYLASKLGRGYIDTNYNKLREMYFVFDNTVNVYLYKLKKYKIWGKVK